MLDRDAVVRACDTFAAAITSHDVDAIMALFAEETSLAEPLGAERQFGHEPIRAFFDSNKHVPFILRRMSPVTVVGYYAAFQNRIEVIEDDGAKRMVSTHLIRFDDDLKISELSVLPDHDSDPDDPALPTGKANF